MIDVPSHQLLLRVNNDLITSTFSSRLSEVRSFYWLSDFSFFARATLTNLTRLEVKNLELRNLTDIISFDVIPRVQSLLLEKSDVLKIETLNLPAYPQLTSLKLYSCSSVNDVSCLDGIHSLELYHCNNITDISPLNNNYRLSISNCDSITTYSRSFRYTHSLQIIDVRPKVIVSLDNCLHLKFLYLSSTMGITNCNINNLMVLSVRSTYLLSLPPNRLQKVSIINCNNLNSLDNMEHIQSIHLEGLNQIKTLTGLGSKNQIITLNNMKQLEDISALKETQSVSIYDCPLLFHLNKLNCLISVKELHLSQGFNCSISSFLLLLGDLHSLEKLNALEILFSSSWSGTGNEFLRFHLLQTFKNVEKISLQGNFIYSVNNEAIQHEFNVNVIKRGICKLILLRKRPLSV